MIALSKTNGSGASRILKFLLKLVLLGLAFWYIFHKINPKKLPDVFQIAHSGWIFAAVLVFSVSKLFASFRLNLYFKCIHVNLEPWENIKLYWLGMFYNLFLPGSIGGDAYKVVRLSKELDVPYKQTAAAVLLDRFSGLAALFILLACYWISIFSAEFHSWLAIAALILTVPVFYLAVRWIFPYLLPCFWQTFAWGMAVQILQILTMFCILKALNLHGDTAEYFLIFLAASVMAVLPFTIGGLGAREMMFLWGAHYFSLDNTLSVMASALFFGVTLISSFFGIIFLFYNPLNPRKQIYTDPI